jgi:hypothetical protein
MAAAARPTPWSDVALGAKLKPARSNLNGGLPVRHMDQSSFKVMQANRRTSKTAIG